MCLPYMSAWICGVVFSTLASWILSKGYLSQVNSMKIFNSLGKYYMSIYKDINVLICIFHYNTLIV